MQHALWVRRELISDQILALSNWVTIPATTYRWTNSSPSTRSCRHYINLGDSRTSQTYFLPLHRHLGSHLRRSALLNMDQVDSSRPTCGSGTRSEDYNLSLHIGALFIILGVSASACAFPLIALKVPQLHVPPRFLFFVRHFGTGVLIATAFVHLFPTAFISLTDPCLPGFWTEDYTAMTGAIALAAVFAITIIEMIFSPERSACSCQVAETAAHETPRPISRASVVRNPSLGGDEISPGKSWSIVSPRLNTYEFEPDLIAWNAPLYGGTRSGRFHKKSVQESAFNNEFEMTDSNQESQAAQSPTVMCRRSNDDIPANFKGKDPEQCRKKLTMQCLLLETSILFHSVFIGMALAVAVGSEQIILLIAIAFHQTFEGLALGSRIAAVGWRPKAPQPWLMALAYGCT